MAGAPEERPEASERLDRLEEQVRVLADAVRTLARGLEPHPVEGLEEERAARAAAQAHDLLLAARL